MFDAQVHEFYFINVRISVSYRGSWSEGDYFLSLKLDLSFKINNILLNNSFLINY